MANMIIVDREDCNLVQKADIESASLMNLITFMVNHNVDISKERFKQYEEEYKQAFIAFETAKSMIEKKYLAGVNAKTWNLSYDNCELTYEN